MAKVLDFPNPETHCDENGILGFSNTLNTPTLVAAYEKGIFPWPISGYPLPWFCPDPRGILRLNRLHIPRSLARDLKKKQFQLTVNQDFSAVIQACASVPRKDKGTWITPKMIEAYQTLHLDGYAHSIEVYLENRLVGGLYGVEVHGCFSAESMFHRESGASKAALLFLLERIRNQGGEWLDIQMVTPHLKALGAQEISRSEFLNLLKSSQSKGLRLF